MQRGLFKKVMNNDKPFVVQQTDKEYFVYKAINAWGDSFRANEFYSKEQPAVFDSNFLKVDSASDTSVIDTFMNKRVALKNSKQQNENNVSLNNLSQKDIDELDNPCK